MVIIRCRQAIRHFIIIGLYILALPATAATFNFRVLIDADATPATGCSIPLPNGSTFPGVEAILTTAVTVDDLTGIGQVNSVTASVCSNPASGTLAQPVPIDTHGWSAAGPNLVVETYLRTAQLRQLLGAGFPLTAGFRLGYVVTPSVGTGGDAISLDAGQPIFLPPANSGRRRAMNPAPPRAVILDGKTDDWGGVDPFLPDDAAFRGSIKFGGVFVTRTVDTMYFRFDAGVGGILFRATPDVLPTAGPAPLTVNFITKAESTGTQIIRYRWDFEGDSIFDTDDPGARNFTRTFTTPGVRKAVLEITNEKKQVTTTTIPITVTGAPPVATASVSPSNGATPLTVNFLGSAIPGTAPITTYEWDFEGDGIFDYNSTTSGNTSHVYSIPGTYSAVFRVTDAAGLRATTRLTATIVRAGVTGSPTAIITLPSSPITRTAPAAISFDGRATTPAGTIAKYEWDFNGDGVYDYASNVTATTTYTYNSPGLYTVAFRVTNSAGLSSVATVDVTVNMTASISLASDTLRPPGSVSIITKLSGTVPVTLFLKNKEGQPVRTLVANTFRVAGSYTDAWDGTDGSGKVVPEGEYFAVLQYAANGVLVTLDLTTITGNALFNPKLVLSTTKDPSNDCSVFCPFAPFENNFLQASLALDRAAEVTISVRGYDSVNEVARLFDRRTFGRGKTYTVPWDGADAKGQLVHPSLYGDRQFIFGMTAFTLPDNAIFVETAPELTNVAVSPNYFDPLTTDFLSPQKPIAKASYTLSKPATVRLQVYRVGMNLLLRTIDVPNALAGTGSVSWDGRDDHGVFADKGDYRLALKAIDAAGNQSLVHYALMKVFY